jgi:SecD/SecF fusion protein
MNKITWSLLFVFIFLFSCQPKGGFDGEIVLQWEDKGSRNDDVKVIEQRLKKIGINKFTIQIINDKTIKVEVKNVKDTLRFIHLMEANAELGFWETYDNTEMYRVLNDLNSRLATRRDTFFLKDSSHVGFEGINDSLRTANAKLENPLWTVLQFPFYMDEQDRYVLLPGAEVGWCKDVDTAYVDSLLRIGSKVIFPKDLVLLWSLKPLEDKTAESNTLNDTYSLIALKKFPGTGGAFMNQKFVEDCKIEESTTREKSLTIKFDKEGTQLWEKMTRKNIGKPIAITLDNHVVSHPNVESAITRGIASITGPGPNEFETIQMGCQMVPFKTTPKIINHHFEKKDK